MMKIKKLANMIWRLKTIDIFMNAVEILAIR
jgi:hypothetical protein